MQKLFKRLTKRGALMGGSSVLPKGTKTAQVPVSYEEWFEQRTREQIAEISSPLNVSGARIAVGHDPTPSECALYYVYSGAAKRFADENPIPDYLNN